MTPLAVLCGFLGAGKTTYLRSLVGEARARGLRPHVILNDYQNATIDAALVREVAQVVEPVSGSCICCASSEELVAALAAVPPGPGQVALVEVNGATDTEAMLEILAEAPLPSLTQPLQLTVVDAQRFGTHDWRNELERVQIRTATHLHLSRTDVVSAARAEEVRRAAQALSPRAPWSAPASLAQALEEIEAAVRDQAPVATERGGPRRHRHQEAFHFACCELPLPIPVEERRFLAFLRALPPSVLRAKGVVALRDHGGDKRSFQVVEGEATISDCALYEPDALSCTAIFIGPHMPVAVIQAALDEAMRPSAPG